MHSGNDGNGSFPMLFLTMISHAETELKNISLFGFLKICLADSLNCASSVVIHKNAQVSSNTFTTQNLQTLELSCLVKVQKMS